MTIASAATVSAEDMQYSYSEDDYYYLWGLKVAQTYDVAVNLGGEAFTGNKMKSIAVPVIVSENIDNYKIWLTTELVLEKIDGKKTNVPNIATVDVTPTDIQDELGWITYTFDEPYTIGANGIFVGYSFTVGAVDNDYDRYPVVVTVGSKDGGLYVHSSKTYLQWKDRSAEVGCVSPIRVTLEGDFPADALCIEPIGNITAQAGEPTSRVINLSNIGANPIASFEYEIEIGDTKTTNTYEYTEPVEAVYNRKATATVEFPACEEGEYDYTFTVTKVNGAPNGANAQCSGTATVYALLPVKQPLVEEFTGTWCGWCPRGWVGMELMSEQHPDFVGIAYHSDDPMMMTAGFPNMASGYPSAVMDRQTVLDPFYGSGNSIFGIEKDWQQCAEGFTPAALTLSANYDASTNSITVVSDVFWAETPEEGEYSIEYVLVGDGLQNMAWVQSNNYATYDPAQYGEEMAKFCAGGEYGSPKVYMLVYNDVALLNSGGKGVSGSVTSIEKNSHNQHSYTFSLSDCGITDYVKNYRVVAMLLKSNTGYGTVVNSGKCAVEGYNSSAIICGDAEVETVKYYDLSGRELRTPQSGICIKSVKYTDGRIQNIKISVK